MTKIILAFPCMGKTYYAQNNPEKAIDLESSDYFFDRTGYEHLSSEEFKGIENRGNNKQWINGVVKFLKPLPYELIEENYHQKMYVHLAPSNSYLTELIENQII